jgi:hypothetical protein
MIFYVTSRLDMFSMIAMLDAGGTYYHCLFLCLLLLFFFHFLFFGSAYLTFHGLMRKCKGDLSVYQSYFGYRYQGGVKRGYIYTSLFHRKR